jgi:transposase
MRKKMPTITESAEALHQRMTQAKDVKQRQRLQALYLVVSGHARSRQELAALLGVHRHSVAAWLDAYAEGGLEKMLSYQVPQPPNRSRITPTALTALQAHLQDPHGCAGYAQLRTWLAEQHQVHLSYSGVYAVVRGKLRAKPKRPRPSHAKKIRKP